MESPSRGKNEQWLSTKKKKNLNERDQLHAQFQSNTDKPDSASKTKLCLEQAIELVTLSL